MTDPCSPSESLLWPSRSLTADEQRWLDCAAHMAAAGKVVAGPLHGTATGRVILGRGAGGDRTLEIDRACEAAIQRVLEAEAPFPHLLVSEELGMTGPRDAPWRVVVDPLDGSLNAKRGLEPFGASIAIADGDTMGDVRVAYIEDYLRPHVFCAVEGVGLLSAGTPAGERASAAARSGGRPPAAAPQPAEAPGASTSATAPATALLDTRRFESNLVEIVLLEAGRPDRHHFQYHDLSALGAVGRSRDMRIRQIGSLALSLCYVATGVADVLVAAVRARSVDLAAGLLILAEAGGGVATLTGQDIWAQPLDLAKRCPFVAWRRGLDEAEIVARSRELARTLLVHP